MTDILDRTKIYVDGAWIESTGSGRIDVLNPATEELIGTVAEGTVEDVDAAAKAARKAFPAWSALSGGERAEYLSKAAAIIAERTDDLAALVSQDMGMPIGFAKPVQIGMPLANLNAFAELARTYDFDAHEVGNSLIVREPAVLIPVLPAAGFTTWPSLILPTVTIAILQIALISRMVRREMVSAFASPYITVARSRGVSERELTWRYAMRNSAIPIVTALGTRFAGMLNGVVVVEVVFAWPGVGSLVVRALETRDYPLIQATVLVTAVLAVLVQLAVDLLYPLLDPRVRLGKGAN